MSQLVHPLLLTILAILFKRYTQILRFNQTDGSLFAYVMEMTVHFDGTLDSSQFLLEEPTIRVAELQAGQLGLKAIKATKVQPDLTDLTDLTEPMDLRALKEIKVTRVQQVAVVVEGPRSRPLNYMACP
jgi:hypothetical protein